MKKKGLSRTYVLVSEQNPSQIKGFYSLALCSIELHELPTELAKTYPSGSNLYCALIGRLAVHNSLQNQGLGQLLLIDAVKEAMRSAIPTPMIIVEAKNEKARKFYIIL